VARMGMLGQHNRPLGQAGVVMGGAPPILTIKATI